jgi:hypothetical protein
MKSSNFVQHALGLLSLVLQVSLIAFTAWFLPTRLTTRSEGWFVIIFGVPAMWILFTVSALFLDGLMGNDVPGGGYILEAIISGAIGFFIYACRSSGQKRA